MESTLPIFFKNVIYSLSSKPWDLDNIINTFETLKDTMIYEINISVVHDSSHILYEM